MDNKEDKAIIESPQVLSSDGEVSLPSMTANISAPEKSLEPPVVDNSKMVKIYEEILQYCKEDRIEADSAYKTFMEMVMNEGESSSSAKELIGQLLRLKHETTNNMVKVMDLLMRVILKGTDTYKPYLNQHQENKVIINTKN